jgi:hypothetical protein
MSLGAPGAAKNLQTVNFAAAAKSSGLKVDAFNLQGMTTFIKA